MSWLNSAVVVLLSLSLSPNEMEASDFTWCKLVHIFENLRWVRTPSEEFF